MKIDLFNTIGKNCDKYKTYYLIENDFNIETIEQDNKAINKQSIIDLINYKKTLKTINESIKITFNSPSKNYKNNFKNYNNSNNYNNLNKSNNKHDINQHSKYTKNNNNNNNNNYNNIKRGMEVDTKWKDNGGSVLRKRLNGKNKQLLEINCEINKLTESNIDIIYDKINIIVINKNTTKIPDDKLKYIFDNIIIKCINQPIFSSLYIKFLNKFNRNVNSKPFIRKEIETIIKHIVEFIDLIEIHDSQMDETIIESKTISNKFNSLIENNKKYEGLGTIYSLFYINKFVDCNMFVEFLKNTIQQVCDYIEWEPCTNEVLEKYVNVLIGLLEFGYHKIIKDIDYETKLTLQMKIENVLSSKKIDMRIKYNLQNLYDDLKAGKKK